MSNEFKVAAIKALQELGRLALIAVLPLLITMLGDGVIDWEALGVVAMVAILKGLDQLVHKYGQETKSGSLEKGIVRF